MDKTRMLRAMAARNPLRTPMQHSSARRRFLQGVGAGIAAASLPGVASAQTRPLSLLTWDAYADPRLLDLWRNQTGVDVRYEIHISDPTSVNRLRAGRDHGLGLHQREQPLGAERDVPGRPDRAAAA